MQNQNYESRLKLLNLPTLEYRRLRGDMIETYKLTHDMYDPLTTSSLLQLNKSSSTRGHPFKLTKQTTTTSLSAHFFTNRVTNIWNNLPAPVVTAGTLNTFKNQLDKHWKNYMFTTNIKVV